MIRILSICAIVLLGVGVTGCGHRSSADVTPLAGPQSEITKKDPALILVTEGDITDRKYLSLGDISVSVSKNTIFDSDPTRKLVDEKLREEAAALGADAVVFARYGAVGITLFSWGSMEGKGRAVQFTK
ncbi:MAG: hypothetical protein AB7N54_15965 [Alphaproteobacteria bacterium]